MPRLLRFVVLAILAAGCGPRGQTDVAHAPPTESIAAQTPLSGDERFDAAERDAIDLLKLDETLIESHLALARLYMNTVDFPATADQQRERATKAEAVLENAIASYPGVADLHLELAHILANMPGRDPTRAIAALKKAVALQPDNAGIWVSLAQATAATSSADANAIEGYLRRAQSLSPENPDVLHAWYRYLSRRPDPPIERILDLIDRRLTSKPDDRSPLLDKALVLSEAKRANEAEEAFREAERVASDVGDEWLLRASREHYGRFLLESGRMAEAEVVLKKSAEGLDEYNRDNNSYWGCPYQALGELYTRMGRVDSAAKSFMDAADAESYTELAQYQAFVKCREAGDWANALRYVERARAIADRVEYRVYEGYLRLIRKEYERAEVLFALSENESVWRSVAAVGAAHLRLIRKDSSGAKVELERACAELPLRTRRDPDRERADPPVLDPEAELRRMAAIMARLGLAWANANENRHLEALESYEEILNAEPDEMLALLGKGNSLMGERRVDEAERVFRRVLELDPNNVYALAELAIVHYNRGDDRAAEAEFQKALALDGQNYTCPYEGLGLVYLRQGKIEDAKKNFEQAIRINPEIEYKKYNGLAKIYLREGRTDEARRLLEKSVANYPHDNEAKTLLARLDADAKTREPTGGAGTP